MVDHCLFRSWNNGSSSVGDMLAEFYTPEVVQEIQALGDYDTYRKKLESGPHGAIHSAVGGDMPPATSPNGQFSLSLSLSYRLTSLTQYMPPRSPLLPPPHADRPSLVALAAARPGHAQLRVRRHQDAGQVRRHDSSRRHRRRHHAHAGARRRPGHQGNPDDGEFPAMLHVLSERLPRDD